MHLYLASSVSMWHARCVPRCSEHTCTRAGGILIPYYAGWKENTSSTFGMMRNGAEHMLHNSIAVSSPMQSPLPLDVYPRLGSRRQSAAGLHSRTSIAIA